MSYIPLGPVLSAIRDPLRHSLKDSDPYVRKTAAICVAKLWMYDPRIVNKEGYITALRDLLADTNPTVVANAVAALTEISDRSDEITLKLNIAVASRLLAALGECSEYVYRLHYEKSTFLRLHQMGPSIHSGVFDELRTTNAPRRGHTGRANICSITARQLGDCAHIH
jgi:vesicle coat complex subunit